ncbi:MAG: PAC2 family protein [Nitrososphaerales archaeon]
MIKIKKKGLKFQDNIFITGFHGIGATGYWTIKYLVQNLDVKRIGFLNSGFIPPFTTTYKESLVTPFELFKWRNLVFFKAETTPYKEELFYTKLCKWVIKSKFKEVSLIGGLDINLRSDDSSYRIVHTSSFKPYGEIAKAKWLEPDQIIVGPVAMILNFFEINDFPAYAILAYANVERVDPRAAASAIEILEKQYNFNVDKSLLIRGAELIESQWEPQRAKQKSESFYA